MGSPVSEAPVPGSTMPSFKQLLNYAHSGAISVAVAESILSAAQARKAKITHEVTISDDVLTNLSGRAKHPKE